RVVPSARSWNRQKKSASPNLRHPSSIDQHLIDAHPVAEPPEQHAQGELSDAPLRVLYPQLGLGFGQRRQLLLVVEDDASPVGGADYEEQGPVVRPVPPPNAEN